MKDLEHKNKEYADKYLLLANECHRVSDKNQQLSRLISCLTSMIAIQGNGNYRELPESVDSSAQALPFKQDSSVKMIRRVLLESLNSLNFYNPSMQPKPIMAPPPPPMLENGPANPNEESKGKGMNRRGADIDSNEYAISKHFQDQLIYPDSPLLLSPFPHSRPPSPLRGFNAAAEGLEPLPNYYAGILEQASQRIKDKESLSDFKDSSYDKNDEKHEKSSSNPNVIALQ